MQISAELHRTSIKVAARLLGVHHGIMMQALWFQECKLVTKVLVPKGKGKVRETWKPEDAVKIVQEKLLECLYKIPVSACITGFVHKGGPIVNAAKHVVDGKIPQWTLQMDFKNAFDSVPYDDVLNIILEELPCLVAEEDRLLIDDERIYKLVAKHFADVMTYEGRTPQGFATSPYLFNLMLERIGLPGKIRKLCDSRGGGIVGSIYADDITFSCVERIVSGSFGGNQQTGNPFSYRFVREVERAMTKWGVFDVNSEKTRITHAARRAPQITGIVLSYDSEGSPRLTLPSRTISRYRGWFQRAAYLLEAGVTPNVKEHGFSLEQLRGHRAWFIGANRRSGTPSRHQLSIPSNLRGALTRFDEAYRTYA